MPVNNLWTLGQVVTPAGAIRGTQDYSLDPGIEAQSLFGDGQVDPTFSAILFAQPMLGFSTTAVASALNIAGIGGYSIAAATDFWFQQLAQGGTRTGGATSGKITCAKGMLIPRQIEAQDGRVATASMLAVAISADGGTCPIVYAANQTMPAQAALTEHFTVGPGKLGSAPITQIKRVTIDPGIDYLVKGGDGECYPTFCAIRRREATVTLRTDALTLLDLAVPLAGSAPGRNLADDPLTVYLTKIAKGGTRVPNTSAEHIAITINDGLLIGQNVGGDDGDPQEMEIVCRATSDLVNDVLAINTASAITLPA